MKNIKDIDKFEFIIDAGANMGLFSMLVRDVAPKARLIILEPDNDNYEMCLKNVALKKEDEIIYAGFWNKTCKLGIKADQREMLDLLKVDIEGSEYEMFGETVEEWIDLVGVLIIEIHDHIKC